MNILFAFVSHGSLCDMKEALVSLSSSNTFCCNTSNNISILILENKYSHYSEDYVSILHDITKGMNLTIHFIENKGYNAGLNCAIQHGHRFDYDILVAGNPDIEFHEKYINALLSTFSSQYLVCVPNVLNRPYLIPQNPRAEKFNLNSWLFKMKIYSSWFPASLIYKFFNKLKNLFKSFIAIQGSSEISRECDVVCGVQFIFSLKRLPLDFMLDENIFLWGEEISLMLLLHKYNSRFLFLPEPIIYHKVSNSVSLLGSLRYFRIQQISIRYLTSRFL